MERRSIVSNWIERYVYDVTHRLPEKDREEVSKELKSNLYDMLSDHADENEIKAVLYELGSPASLAEKYRQKPRYLISPFIYDDYVRALKWILPLVGVVVLAVGMIWGAVDAIQYSVIDWPDVIKRSISKGISLGIAAVFHALVWTTIGFAIAERTRVQADKNNGQEWKIEDLPAIPPDDKGKIPLSDSIPELVLTLVFSVAGILLCTGLLPFVFIIQTGDTQVRSLFSPEFLAGSIPAIVVMALFGICQCISKIKDRQWTPFVCGTVIASNLIDMGIMVYLINRPDLFSAEFTAFVQGIEWGDFDILRFVGTGGINPVMVFISVVIVVCSLANCCKAIYKTYKNKKDYRKGSPS